MTYQNFSNGNGNDDVVASIGGRRFGIAASMITCARVAGSTTYIPAHTINGKNNSQRLLVPVLHNTRRGAQDKPSRFTITIWGPLADVGAKFLSPGRAIDGLFEMMTYKAPLFTQDGQIRLDNQGQQIVIDKTVQTSLRMEMGEESHKFIEGEIAQGRRPMDWRTNQGWKDYMSRKAAEVFQVGMNTYGFARVVVPNGAQVNMAAYQKNTGGYNAQPAQNTYQNQAVAQNAYQPSVNPTPQNVQQSFQNYNNAPVNNTPVSGAPVWVPPQPANAGGATARSY